MDLKVGDTVYHIDSPQKIGKVIHITDYQNIFYYGVEYRELVENGHNCGGKGKFGFCFYEIRKDIKKISQQLELFEETDV